MENENIRIPTSDTQPMSRAGIHVSHVSHVSHISVHSSQTREGEIILRCDLRGGDGKVMRYQTHVSDIEGTWNVVPCFLFRHSLSFYIIVQDA